MSVSAVREGLGSPTEAYSSAPAGGGLPRESVSAPMERDPGNWEPKNTKKSHGTTNLAEEILLGGKTQKGGLGEKQREPSRRQALCRISLG